ncbi:MAG: hypothetical protein MN733_23875 [Nitrososphaera sp.]|nr:hypothetical protein [Nitrososphaera sp.]
MTHEENIKKLADAIDQFTPDNVDEAVRMILEASEECCICNHDFIEELEKREAQSQ